MVAAKGAVIKLFMDPTNHNSTVKFNNGRNYRAHKVYSDEDMKFLSTGSKVLSL